MAKEKVNKENLSINDVLSSINKEIGDETIYYAAEQIGKLDVIPFSIPSLNRISGIGGAPKGRIIEFSGMDGTHKTTFALDLISQEQKQGGTCAFIDAEYSFSPEYAEKIGVNNEQLILAHPVTAEEAFTIMEKLIDSKKVTTIVLDSIASLSPNAESENDFGASNMGVFARLMGQMFRKLTSKAGKNNVALIFINQLREQLGGYVPMKITPGGNALRFYASIRYEISKSAIKDGQDIKGATLKVKCIKNKLAVPFLSSELEAIYGEGIDKIKDLINESIICGIIDKAGAGWLTYGDTKVQGVDNFKQLLVDNEEFKQELELKLNEYYSRTI